MLNFESHISELFTEVQELKSGKSQLYEMYWITGKIDLFEFKLLIQDNSENTSSIIIRSKIKNEIDFLKRDIVIKNIFEKLKLVGKEIIIDELITALKNDNIEMSKNIVVEINIGDNIFSNIELKL